MSPFLVGEDVDLYDFHLPFLATLASLGAYLPAGSASAGTVGSVGGGGLVLGGVPSRVIERVTVVVPPGRSRPRSAWWRRR